MKRHDIDPNTAEPTGEGYFTEDSDTKQAGCDDDVDRCAESDYDEDPYADRNVPGTVDDKPYTLGEQRPNPADEHIVAADAPVHESARKHGRDDTGALGDADAADLWREQKGLIDEDEEESVNLDGFEPEEAAGVLDATVEGVEDPLPDAPNGVSATGSPFEPEHGGFPERTE